MTGNSNRLLRTPFATLVRNLLIIYLTFFLCHIIFAWYNWDAFRSPEGPSVTWNMIKGAFVFDTAGIMYLTAPYILLTMFPLHFKERRWYYVLSKTVLIVCISAGLLANFADTLYYPYTGCRSTLQVLTEFSNEGGTQIMDIFLKTIIDNWYMLLLLAAMIVFLCRAIRMPDVLRFHRTGVYYLVRTSFFAICMLGCVAGIRGGLAHNIRPITMSNAYQYVDRPVQAAAILNTPFCAIRTAGHKSLTVPKYYSAQELEEIYTPVTAPDTTATFQPRNVVVFILESFGSEYIGAMNPDKEGIHDCTPFLNSLMSKSLSFSSSLANGRKSIDAMPSVLSGIPMIKEHFFLSSTMLTKDVSGLAEELGHKGYYSAFFHGADNGSMGFQSFSRVIGFQDYFSLEDFEADATYGGHDKFDGYWAIWDEEFLQFMCDRIGTFSQPFVASVFTASSHHPYNIPEQYGNVFLNEGGLPIYRGIKYSDNALRLFFEKAAGEPWFENTLFVLTADHTNLSEHPDYQSDYGQFRVPIIFYSPSDSIEGVRQCLAQQSDILPSVLGYLGYDRPFISFGQDLFHTADNDVWAVNFQNDLYMFYQGSHMIQFDGENVVGMFDFKADPAMKNNLKGTVPDLEAAMLKKLKAIIQQYMDYMVNKDLVIR